METEDKSVIRPFKTQGGDVCFLRELRLWRRINTFMWSVSLMSDQSANNSDKADPQPAQRQSIIENLV